MGLEAIEASARKGDAFNTPYEKLAESLAALKELQDRRIGAIRSSDLSRTPRERLLKSGFL